MEIFIFPELIFSLVLGNILSPRLWRWRELEWFAGIRDMRPKKRLQRLRQHIMDNYTFNLDLDTWGLTTQKRELERFATFLKPEEIASSNALFGYQGDVYYYDIDIRRHFGLDKYTSDTIPYWKTETIEAMDAFRYKEGHLVGAGECVSLAALYAAAAFVVCGLPLESIYMMATPLHSQNYIDADTGILTNNRRLVTKAMWANGTIISKQARRALENERVTIVTHATGYIHLLYPKATIDKNVYSSFCEKLNEYLIPPKEAVDQSIVKPRLPDMGRVEFSNEDAPLALDAQMSREEIASRLGSIAKSSRVAALVPYAARELGEIEAAPFMKASLERCPVSKAATLEEIEKLAPESIYDGPSRVATSDEAWNFRRADGFEKCVLAANALSLEEGSISVEGGMATLRAADARTICEFKTSKRPREKLIAWNKSLFNTFQSDSIDPRTQI